MTNTTPHGQLPEALRLALSIDLMDTFTDYQQEELNKAAAELRRQHDRIAELEAELEAIGAGGVALSAAPTITPETGNAVSAKGAAITSESGAVYAELPAPTASIGIDDAWHEPAMRDFADRTHALRMQQAAPKAAPVVWLSSKQLRGVTALHGQYLPFRCQPEGRFDTPVYLVEAAPKAAPVEQDLAAIEQEIDETCMNTPPGWRCTRKAGHDGPCAAVPCPEDLEFVASGMERIRKAEAAPQPAPAPLSDDAFLQMRGALEAARNGLTWFMEMHPEDCNGSDDEMLAQIDAALAAQGGK